MVIGIFSVNNILKHKNIDQYWTPHFLIAGLGEYRIRDLNDEINKLLREKYHWEVQIFNLGGPNYRRIGPRYLDREGREVPGNRGYRYFGAARELPGRKRTHARKFHYVQPFTSFYRCQRIVWTRANACSEKITRRINERYRRRLLRIPRWWRWHPYPAGTRGWERGYTF